MERLQGLDRFLAENVKGVSVNAQAVQAHVIGPPISYSAASDRGPQARTVPFELRLPPPGLPYPLNVAAFEIALDNALKDVVAGYVAQLRQSGQILFTKAWQYAQRSPQDGVGELWTADVQMHVASVSKLMTAMAMTVLLADNNISPDAQIINYLPRYWTKGPNIEYIVFRNLFNHTSGLSAYYLVNFDIMKSAIAGGIKLPIAGGNNLNTLGQYNYQNLNYALCRILLAVINGNINRDAYFGRGEANLNDKVWDVVTISAYEAYLQAKVFGPSDVVGATLDHPTACALAYVGPNDPEPGWDSGSLQRSCGADGWHLSVNQLLDVMGEFRRGGGILTAATAQAMLDNGFGVDSFDNTALPAALSTPAGNVYCKPGDWSNNNNQDEQSLAFFLPDNMELVVLVNSKVDGQTGPPNNHFRQVVTQAYLDSLTTPLPGHL